MSVVKSFTIDGRAVRSFPDFVEAVNVGFVEQVGGRWNGNLDAFNDYLSWQEGVYELELLDAASCARNLGHAAQAAWLRGCVTTSRHATHQMSTICGFAWRKPRQARAQPFST